MRYEKDRHEEYEDRKRMRKEADKGRSKGKINRAGAGNYRICPSEGKLPIPLAQGFYQGDSCNVI